MTIKRNMFNGLIVNDTELHSIDSIGFLKVLQQQAITALYHIQFEITSLSCNGNVTTDIFLHRQNDNPTRKILYLRVVQNSCKGEIRKARWKKIDVKTTKTGWMSQNEMKGNNAITFSVVSFLELSNETRASEILSARHKIQSCVSRFPSSFLLGFHFI